MIVESGFERGTFHQYSMIGTVTYRILLHYLRHSVYCTYRISLTNLGPIVITPAPGVYRSEMLIFLLGSENPFLANDGHAVTVFAR